MARLKQLAPRVGTFHLPLTGVAILKLGAKIRSIPA